MEDQQKQAWQEPEFETKIKITDAQLVSDKPAFFRGHVFTCLACGLNTLLPYYGFCPHPDCGAEVEIDSKVVNDFLSKQNP